MAEGAKIKAGVVGVGYLGWFHAQKYAALKMAELVGVADTNAERAREVADKLGVAAFTDYRALFGRVQCASVAVPTQAHYDVAKALLENGIDVLVEKPIAANTAEARELVELARANGRILQVGHLERFNPAIRALDGILREPKFIECHRLSPFLERGTDVDVVFDLMIHDIDVIASLVRSPVHRVEAVGVPVLTDKPDIANARITFADGCIANVTSSRVSLKRERKIRFFQPDAYISIDYDRRQAQVYHKPQKGGGWQDIRAETIEMGDGDALADEIASFLEVVEKRGRPMVSGEDGLRALEIASMISEKL
ncbi:MAG TPA: Gfo/Idh/MocA family oxidoreductase [Candidatus Acidoferrales bacterium]|nr:Gfo/Idh/MocA family oxidoreductase [Candidatus Acidoferrales bacterium]